MPDSLDLLRKAIRSRADAVRWACLLEAIAPKPGNVYPGRPFHDMQYKDFVAAAEHSASALALSSRLISQRMLAAVELSRSQLRINANLGIVLLLGPLVAADELLANDISEPASGESWAQAIAHVLAGFDGTDGSNIYQAIYCASAGGLGEVDELDVRDGNHTSVDIVQAMTLAADRDTIARQYATGFADLIERVVPLLRESIIQRGDFMSGIVDAHIRLLAMEPDSLIARKNGLEVAVEVQERARNVDLDEPASIAEFDESLRGIANQLNPGTTADLIAAALYMLLRTPNHDETK